MANSIKTSSLSGTLFLLGQVWEIAPARILLAVVSRCFSFSYGAFYTLLFFRHFLNAAQAGVSMLDTAWFFVLFMCFGFADTLIKAYTEQIHFPKVDPVISRELQRMLQTHALSIDYPAYESPAFYDSYSAAASHAGEQALQLVQHVAQLVASGFALVLNVGFAATVEPGVLIVALLPTLALYMLQGKQNRARYRYEQEKIRPER